MLQSLFVSVRSSVAAAAAVLTFAGGWAAASTLSPAAPALPSEGTGAPLSTPAGAQALFQKMLDAVRQEYALLPETSLFAVQMQCDARNPRRLVLTGSAADQGALAALCAALLSQGAQLENNVRVLPEKLEMKDRIWAVVTVPEAVLRSSTADDLTAADLSTVESRPSTTTLSLGMPVKLYAKDASGRLRLAAAPDGSMGWLRAEDLFIGTDATLIAWNRRDKVIVTAPNAVLYAAQDDQAAPSDRFDGEAEAPERLALAENGTPIPMGSILALEHGAPAQALAELGVPASDKAKPSAALQTARPSGKAAPYWRVRLPSGAVRYLAVGDAAPLPAFESKTEARRRSNPSAFLADIAQNAAALSGRAMTDSAFLRSSFLGSGLVVPTQTDRAAYIARPRLSGKNYSAVRAGDLLAFGSRKTLQPEHIGIALGRGEGAAVVGGVVKRMPLKSLEKVLGSLLWTERLDASALADPCMLSTRSHPYWQTPPVDLAPCRLRPHGG